jgi:hypothetical protein
MFKYNEDIGGTIMKVIGISMVGGAYHRGKYCPGWGKLAVELDNGTVKEYYVPSKHSNGFDAILKFADESGFDTEQQRKDIDNWVKTGRGVSFDLV